MISLCSRSTYVLNNDREFSVENVLFLIEIVNFKRLMVKLGHIPEELVPFEFLEAMNRGTTKFGRTSSFSMSMSSKMSQVNNHTTSDFAPKQLLQLSLHESIKVVQDMEKSNDNDPSPNNLHTSLTSTSSFLKSLSRATNANNNKSKTKSHPKTPSKSNSTTIATFDQDKEIIKPIELRMFAKDNSDKKAKPNSLKKEIATNDTNGINAFKPPNIGTNPHQQQTHVPSSSSCLVGSTNTAISNSYVQKTDILCICSNIHSMYKL